MQTYVLIFTKNHPFRPTYHLDENLKEEVTESLIENFIPYTRTVYVRANEEFQAQRKVFDHMRKLNLTDWDDLIEKSVID